MNKITMDKATLIGILKGNLNNHIDEFKETYTNWLSQYRDKLQQELTNDDPTGSVHLLKPESHTRDYEVAISMLEHDTESTVVLDRHQYEQYVMDDWDWKGRFEITKSTYNNSTR